MSRYIITPAIIDLMEVGEATDHEFLEAANVIAAMTAALRDVKARWEAAAIKHLGNRSIESGGVRYYVGVDKQTKCLDQKHTLEAMLETGGPAAVAGCLSSGAFKHGACRDVLGDQWVRHFEVVEKPDLKTGKPERKLQRVDEKYLT